MTTDLHVVRELICPVCGKMLTSDEYEHAIEEISLKLGAEYQQQLKKDRSEFEEQIQNERKISQERIDNMNRTHGEQLNILRSELSVSYKAAI